MCLCVHSVNVHYHLTTINTLVPPPPLLYLGKFQYTPNKWSGFLSPVSCTWKTWPHRYGTLTGDVHKNNSWELSIWNLGNKEWHQNATKLQRSKRSKDLKKSSCVRLRLRSTARVLKSHPALSRSLIKAVSLTWQDETRSGKTEQKSLS